MPHGSFSQSFLPLEMTTKVAPAARPVASGSAKVDWLRNLRMPDFSMKLTTPVVERLEHIRENGWLNDSMKQLLQRSGRYAPLIRRILREEGVPEDLLYVAMIESSYDPSAKSPAGAAGLWQFMPKSGQELGLKQNRWVDERRDPERSTRVAARTFKKLYQRFGTWELAFAAYNMGYYGLVATIKTYNSNNFWLLRSYEYALPSETRNYVPRILAAAIVACNRERFGFGDLELDDAWVSEALEVPRSINFSRLARILGTSREELARLNPELVRGRTPPGVPQYTVRVPLGTAHLAAGKLRSRERQNTAVTQHRVRTGEDLATVAKQYGISKSKLASLNEITPRTSLEPGSFLIVPAQRKSPEVERESEERTVAIVPAQRFTYRDRRRVFYRTVRGDTVARIASAFGVTRAEIVMWNSLAPSAVLQTGMVLQLFISTRFDRWDEVRHLREGQVRLFVAGSIELFEEMARQRELRRFVYRTRRGDSLKKLSRRFGLSVSSIVRINHFSRNHSINPGDEVVLYVEPQHTPQRASQRSLTATLAKTAAAGEPGVPAPTPAQTGSQSVRGVDAEGAALDGQTVASDTAPNASQADSHDVTRLNIDAGSPDLDGQPASNDEQDGGTSATDAH